MKAGPLIPSTNLATVSPANYCLTTRIERPADKNRECVGPTHRSRSDCAKVRVFGLTRPRRVMNKSVPRLARTMSTMWPAERTLARVGPTTPTRHTRGETEEAASLPNRFKSDKPRMNMIDGVWGFFDRSRRKAQSTPAWPASNDRVGRQFDAAFIRPPIRSSSVGGSDRC
jgi:hypothetical protein